MKTIYSDKHTLRQVNAEIHNGELVPPFERKERIDYILKELNKRGFDKPISEHAFNLDTVHKVHSKDYVNFLQNVWQKWLNAGHTCDAIPNIWPSRSMPSKIIPTNIEAQLGYYALAAETAISAGTWQAVNAAKDVALTAAEHIIQGEKSAFALCRPPGHHAARDQFGGYCFLNNAAIAAQHLRDNGYARVSILDVDYHHGNGTQQIFYRRNDVQTLSIHGDPDFAFPYFLGHANETGENEGEGYCFNYPLAAGSDYTTWRNALKKSFEQIKQFNAEILVVSLGVDTFENDPISAFKLKSDDFYDYGKRIAELGLPTLFVMEGGYAVEEIGINTVNVLEGFNSSQA
ncbi:MAG: histone deacetylase family protein [Marinomonas sp.]